jgi:hypothetical protein
MSEIEHILERLNGYTGDNVWGDVIRQLDIDDEASLRVDAHGGAFVLAHFLTLTELTVIRYDQQRKQWYADGRYEAATETPAAPTPPPAAPPVPDGLTIEKVGELLHRLNAEHPRPLDNDDTIFREVGVEIDEVATLNADIHSTGCHVVLVDGPTLSLGEGNVWRANGWPAGLEAYEGRRLLGPDDEPTGSGAIVAVWFGDPDRQQIWVSQSGNWYRLSHRFIHQGFQIEPAPHPQWHHVLAAGPVVLLVPAQSDAYDAGWDAGRLALGNALYDLLDGEVIPGGGRKGAVPR